MMAALKQSKPLGVIRGRWTFEQRMRLERASRVIDQAACKWMAEENRILAVLEGTENKAARARVIAELDAAVAKADALFIAHWAIWEAYKEHA